MAPTMRAFVFCIFLALAASATAKIKGMAFSTGHDLVGYRLPSASTSMNKLKRTGANYVHISAYSRMSSLTADSLTDVTDEASVRFIVRKAKKRGFKVFFKPVIEPEGAWRGFIPGGDSWFRKVYIPFIIKWAKIAEQEKIDLFAVGSEYRATIGQTKQWLRVIRKVKKVYKGMTTYVGNHDAYFNVKFFHKLTFISISGYFKLLPGERGFSPNLAWTKRAWNKKAGEVLAWKRKNRLKQPVLIAEVGAQSKGDGVVYRVPWAWDIEAPLNYFEQVKMYEGLLGAFMPKDWCAGVILWHWELDPNAGLKEPSLKGYTPQNKPALKVMTRFYKRKYD